MVWFCTAVFPPRNTAESKRQPSAPATCPLWSVLCFSSDRRAVYENTPNAFNNSFFSVHKNLFAIFYRDFRHSASHYESFSARHRRRTLSSGFSASENGLRRPRFLPGSSCGDVSVGRSPWDDQRQFSSSGWPVWLARMPFDRLRIPSGADGSL